MYLLEVEGEFSAAHQLRGYQGKCEQLHGHNWRVRVALAGKQLDECGMLIDFGEVKAFLAETLDALDHRFLNEQPPFDRDNPTSERIARLIAEDMAAKVPDHVRVEAATVWESERCRATYRPVPPA